VDDVIGDFLRDWSLLNRPLSLSRRPEAHMLHSRFSVGDKYSIGLMPLDAR